MAGYTVANLIDDVEDLPPRFGYPPGMQAGPDGAEILAFGAPSNENRDAEMVAAFWPR